MESLYCVELVLTTAVDIDLEEALREHVAVWLSHGGPSAVAGTQLLTDGEVVQDGASGHLGSRRHLRWTAIGADPQRAVRLDVRTPLTRGSGDFVCRVTISGSPSRGALRVVLGRDAPDGVLEPLPLDYIRRPHLLGQVLTDGRLVAMALGTRVDGRYLSVDDHELPRLVPMLSDPRRLPLLLVPPSPGSPFFAKQAARELAGLAQVLLLTQQTARSVAEALPEVMSEGEATLVWPTLSFRHPRFSLAEMGRPSQVVHKLIRLLGPLSVAARGTDNGWEAARRRQRQLNSERYEEALRAARDAGDPGLELAVLRQQVEGLKVDSDGYIEEIDSLEQQVNDLRAARAEAENWRSLYLGELSGAGDRKTESIPSLAPGSGDACFDALTRLSDGAIVFTRNARRVWAKCDYPDPQRMTDHLAKLTEAASRWRDQESSVGRALNEWLKDEFAMNVSLGDKSLVNRKIDTFTHEDETYSRIPHVQVDDYTTAERCGRIYFALDASKHRFVVDHVGLHL